MGAGEGIEVGGRLVGGTTAVDGATAVVGLIGGVTEGTGEGPSEGVTADNWVMLGPVVD